MHKSCNELQIGNQFPNWSQRKSKLHSLCKNLNEVGTIFNYCKWRQCQKVQTKLMQKVQGVQDQNLPKEIGITKKLCTSDP